MKRLTRPLACLAACCMLLLGGCKDKNVPLKPTVATAQQA
jgi:hypothetical protein